MTLVLRRRDLLRLLRARRAAAPRPRRSGPRALPRALADRARACLAEHLRRLARVRSPCLSRRSGHRPGPARAGAARRRRRGEALCGAAGSGRRPLALARARPPGGSAGARRLRRRRRRVGRPVVRALAGRRLGQRRTHRSVAACTPRASARASCSPPTGSASTTRTSSARRRRSRATLRAACRTRSRPASAALAILAALRRRSCCVWRRATPGSPSRRGRRLPRVHEGALAAVRRLADPARPVRRSGRHAAAARRARARAELVLPLPRPVGGRRRRRGRCSRATSCWSRSTPCFCGRRARRPPRRRAASRGSGAAGRARRPTAAAPTRSA